MHPRSLGRVPALRPLDRREGGLYGAPSFMDSPAIPGRATRPALGHIPASLSRCLRPPPPRSREPGPARATFLLTVPASQARRERLSSSAFPRASFSHSPTAPVGCTLPASLPRAALKAR
jgi:hypothetical protein